MTLSYLNKIRIIKDFPKKGINFYDISSLLSNPYIFNRCLLKMIKKTKKFNPTAIVGIDYRGFIFASIIAYKLKLKIVMIRKKGKLPGSVYKSSYKLEYGSNTLELQKGFLNSKDRVLLIDDIFATSGTMNASVSLIKKSKAKITGALVLLELVFLKGKKDFKFNLESIEKANN